MATKTITGSPLKRVLNRSLTWKETFNMRAPESEAIDAKYATALKAFESIPDFPDEWAELQQRYVKLSGEMRTLESTLVEADKGKRDAHALLIDKAKTDADDLTADVLQRLKQDKEAAGKGLARIGMELRDLLDRFGKGDPAVDADIDYVGQLGPAISALRMQAGALERVSGRHSAIDDYMGKRGFVLAEPVDVRVKSALEALKRFDELNAVGGQWKKLQSDAGATKKPPARREFQSLYGNDASAMEKARIGFEAICDKLTERKDKIVQTLSEGKAYFGGPEFAKLTDDIHKIARMDKRRQIEEAEKLEAQRSTKAPKKPVVTETEEPPPPVLPPRPRDESAGRTIVILNPGLEPSSVLTNAEESKRADFLRLHNQVVAHRVRDTMNDVFGNFEIVNHPTVRLSRRRRLEFDMDMSVGGQVQITLVNIGDPTYEH
jgi:hypothetical protein